MTLEGCRGTTNEFATIPFRKTLRRGETRDSLKDCTSHCSSYKLKPIWRDKMSFGSKVKLMRILAISIFLYACESWTLTAEIQKRTHAFEMRCYQRLLNILYKNHISNEEVRRKIKAAIGEYDELLNIVRRETLSSFATSECLLV